MAKKPKAPKPAVIVAPSAKTVPKQLTPWKPGQSGNPAGRPKGARHKLGEAFLEALHKDFLTNGEAAITACRILKPDVYVRVIGDLLRKEIVIAREDEAFDQMSDHDLQVFVADVMGRRRALEEAASRRGQGEAGATAAAGKGKPGRVH